MMETKIAMFDPTRPYLGGRIAVLNGRLETNGLMAGHLIYSRSTSRPDEGRYSLIDPHDGSGDIDLRPGQAASIENSYRRNLGQYHIESVGSRVTVLVSDVPA